MSKNGYVAWIDLETTGTDEELDPIIEVAVIVTDFNFVEKRSAQWVIKPYLGVDYYRDKCASAVRKMHDENGLWNACRDGRPMDEVDEEFATWLQSISPGQFTLAGSGVSHFDGRFIRKQLSVAAKALTYYSLDVGVLRRFLLSADLPGAVPEAGDSSKKSHRAMDDIRAHLLEGQHYRRVLREALIGAA